MVRRYREIHPLCIASISHYCKPIQFTEIVRYMWRVSCALYEVESEEGSFWLGVASSDTF